MAIYKHHRHHHHHHRQQQQQLLLHMWTDISRGHQCLRRSDIAMAIAIFTGQSVLKYRNGTAVPTASSTYSGLLLHTVNFMCCKPIVRAPSAAANVSRLSSINQSIEFLTCTKSDR